MIIKVYQPTCGPCKVVDKYLKDLKIPYVSADATSDEIIPELGMSGADVIEKYHVRSTPTLLKLDENKTLVKTMTGLQSPDEVSTFCK